MPELVVFGKKVRISEELDLALTILASTIGISKSELAEEYLRRWAPDLVKKLRSKR